MPKVDLEAVETRMTVRNAVQEGRVDAVSKGREFLFFWVFLCVGGGEVCLFGSGKG